MEVRLEVRHEICMFSVRTKEHFLKKQKKEEEEEKKTAVLQLLIGVK